DAHRVLRAPGRQGQAAGGAHFPARSADRRRPGPGTLPVARTAAAAVAGGVAADSPAPVVRPLAAQVDRRLHRRLPGRAAAAERADVPARSPGAVPLYLIRHTRVGCTPGLCYGQLDVPLAESFAAEAQDRKSTRLNSSHVKIS